MTRYAASGVLLTGAPRPRPASTDAPQSCDDLVEGYDPESAPAILVPKEVHTRRGSRGTLARGAARIRSVRQLIARDIRELRRVYPDIPNTALRQLIQMNQEMYPQAMAKPPRSTP